MPALIEIQKSRSHASSHNWTDEVVFHSGDCFFDQVLTAINNAERSVEFEVFIFESDALGHRVAESLARAALRGVRVRLCVDGVGSWRVSPDLLDKLERAGVEWKFYHPLPWHSRAGEFALSLGKLNRRNHRKLWIIDHEVAFVGSMNVSSVHSVSHFGEKAWRDIGVKLKGPPLVWLRAAFESVWQPERRARHWREISESALSFGAGRSGRSLVELNLSRASRRRKNRDIVRRIRSARDRVWLIKPYFVPSLNLLLALKDAAARGVDVRVLVPKKSDLFFMAILGRTYFKRLVTNGVRVYEYLPSMLHAKIALIDDWVRVGSSNLNQRSLLHDLEVNVILCKRSSILSVEQQVHSDFEQSSLVTLRELNEKRLLNRLGAWFIRLFRKWL